MSGAIANTRPPTAVLKQMLYKKQADRIQVTFKYCFLPSSSAVRYMVAVRMPAIPATMDRLLTDMTSCRRPTPEAPIRPEIYTWNEVPAIRSSRLTAVSSNALKKIGTCRCNRIPPCPHSMARGVGVCCGWLILGLKIHTVWTQGAFAAFWTLGGADFPPV